MLTTFDLDEYALAALRGGASGFLLKDIPPENLVTAVRSVATGDAVVAPASPGDCWNGSWTPPTRAAATVPRWTC